MLYRAWHCLYLVLMNIFESIIFDEVIITYLESEIMRFRHRRGRKLEVHTGNTNFNRYLFNLHTQLLNLFNYLDLFSVAKNWSMRTEDVTRLDTLLLSPYDFLPLSSALSHIPLPLTFSFSKGFANSTKLSWGTKRPKILGFLFLNNKIREENGTWIKMLR